MGGPFTTGSDPAEPLPAELRLILVEDRDDDALLVERALTRAGFAPVVRRVQTRVAFLAALDEHPEIVISDHSLPHFSSTGALKCLREQGLDVPFIVVSGTIDEESAVTLLKAGAHDFVTKQNLARLGPAVRRELREAVSRAERRRMQQALDAERRFLRLVIDTSPGLIFAKDCNGRFTLANRTLADLYGRAPQDVEGRTHEECWNARPGGDFLHAEQAVLACGDSRLVPGEALTDPRTGIERWFETRMVPLVLPDGTPQVLGVGTEITERRQAEEALKISEEQFRQAQKMEVIGQLAGGIAHDFNNVLTAILGYSDLIGDQVGDNPALAADLQEVRGAALRAAALTSQLLALGRKQVSVPQVLDLTAVVSGVHQMLNRLLPDNVRLEVAVSRDVPCVQADRGQMEQVLLNLVINARDAMPAGGTIRLEIGLAADGVLMTVTDSGCGMPPEVRDRIFEPFFTTKPVGKGTGLGLSMVFGTVSQSGGRITVESAVGQGTRFTIALPAARDIMTDAEVDAPAPARQGSETILLVEDEIAVRQLVRKVLTGYGYSMLEASDTDDAVRIAREYPGDIHLLLSDVTMPAMDGPTLAQHLVRLRPDMRVVYMSGVGGSLAQTSGRVRSGVKLLSKPFTPDRLAARVRECLDLSPAR